MKYFKFAFFRLLFIELLILFSINTAYANEFSHLAGQLSGVVNSGNYGKQICKVIVKCAVESIESASTGGFGLTDTGESGMCKALGNMRNDSLSNVAGNACSFTASTFLLIFESPEEITLEAVIPDLTENCEAGLTVDELADRICSDTNVLNYLNQQQINSHCGGKNESPAERHASPFVRDSECLKSLIGTGITNGVITGFQDLGDADSDLSSDVSGGGGYHIQNNTPPSPRSNAVNDTLE